MFKYVLVVTIVACIFIPLASEAEESPRWIKKPPVEDKKNRFYVGRASGTESESKLIERAIKNAREMAIAENFGILTSISKESYETMSSTSMVSKVSELSKRVILRKFRKKDQHIDSNGGEKHVWILFQYPKIEIRREVQRLEKEETAKVPVQFSEFNATQSAIGGYVQVSTSPQGTSITVNDKSYGFSPAKIRLEPGLHTILLDHPHFYSAKEKVIIQEKETSKLNKTLVRAKRQIYIQTTPEGAVVELSGKYLGISPVKTTIPTGDKQILFIKHPETEDHQNSIRVGKGESVYLLKVPLVLRPSYFTIDSTPQGAEVYQNNKLIGQTPTKLSEGSPGDKIRVVKSGYINHRDTLKIKGGEHRQLSINLLKQDKFKSKLNSPDLVRIAVESENTNIISMMIESGVDLNAKYEDGETLLGLVMGRSGESGEDMIALLVKHGADIGRSGESSEDMIALLVKHGADINALDRNGQPLLHKAVETYGCNTNLFSIFFENDANMSVKDFSKNIRGRRAPATTDSFHIGSSLLHTIAQQYEKSVPEKCLDIASQLIENGAKMDVRDDSGKTPMDYIKNRDDRREWAGLLLRQKLAEPCDNGDMSSCVSLANMEEKEGNEVRAQRFLSKACEGGLLDICLQLGFKEKGWGNEMKSKYFFSKACQGGHASACSEAGLIEKNLGFQDQANLFFSKACKGGDLSGCYETGIIEKSLKNYTQAASYLNTACAGGEEAACLESIVVEGKQKEIAERKLASENRAKLVRVFERTILDQFFSIGIGVIGGSWGQVNYNKVIINAQDKTDKTSNKNLTYGEAFSISADYTKFINRNYFNIGLDVTTTSQSEGNSIFTIQPISLFSNLGTTIRAGGRSCLKLFGGVGLSYVKPNAEGIAADGSLGYLFQLGTGFIQSKFHIDLIFRSIFSPKAFQYDLKVNNRSYEVREDLDLLIFQPMLRIGFSF